MRCYHGTRNIPDCFFDSESGEYVCHMKDKKSGKILGVGYGSTRNEAISNARQTQPADGRIKRMIGWTTRHPVIVGSLAGAALAFRDAKHNDYYDWKRYAKFALIGAGVGLALYIGGKIIKSFLQGVRDATGRRSQTA